MDYGEKISLILKSLPEKPGVYRFFDDEGTIIYVGKAKKLKRRVSSYFNKQHDNRKVRVMVSKIRDIQTTVVNSEWEALLLENSMIKEYKPRYNIMLKDDKTYPWLAVSKEDFPRIFSTRNPDKNTMQLFGPYASVHYLNTLMDTIRELFPLRTCRRLTQNSRPCIQHQIGKCPAPCAKLISKEDYQEEIKTIIEIIKGNSKLVQQKLKDQMMKYAENWEFEKAQVIKRKLEVLDNYIGKSVVVNPTLTRLDVLSLDTDDESGYINFLRIMNGAIIQSYTFEINNKLDKTEEDLLLTGMLTVEDKFGPLFPDVVVPFMPELVPEGTNFIVPQRGDKYKLLELSQKNAQYYKLEKKKRQDLVDPERRHQRVLVALQKALNMDRLPRRIECFDNSNTQGEEPVASMVCFIDGKPAKKEYRHFLIKTVVGPDDFGSMEEVVYRRYHRLLEEGKDLPDLLMVDGGKGQLNAGYSALKALHIENRLMIIGIAKRLEDIYKVGDELPTFIDKKSEAQKLLQHLRDEAHRFGITHHRKRRAKHSIASRLDDIPGIGEVLKNKLLTHFKSVKNIENASEEELAKVIGPAKAAKVLNALSQAKN
jgi:excinuclease ABC subunit C